jgi:hypothetical protein
MLFVPTVVSSTASPRDSDPGRRRRGCRPHDHALRRLRGVAGGNNADDIRHDDAAIDVVLGDFETCAPVMTPPPGVEAAIVTKR